MLAILLYMVGMLLHQSDRPASKGGHAIRRVAVKLAHRVSPRIQEGSQVVYKFFRTAVTYPILFAVRGSHHAVAGTGARAFTVQRSDRDRHHRQRW